MAQSNCSINAHASTTERKKEHGWCRRLFLQTSDSSAMMFDKEISIKISEYLSLTAL